MTPPELRPINSPSITFVFPPFCESAYHGPHLAIPLLRAVLQEAGIASAALDLNLESFHSLLSPASVEAVLDFVARSRLPPHAQRKAHACLTRLKTLGLQRFMKPDPRSLKAALKFLREILFPSPKRLEEALYIDLERAEIATKLYQTFINRLGNLEPDVVAISVAFSEQLAEAIELTRRIRTAIPTARVLLGGSQINLLEPSQLQLLSDSGLFDAISVGNGEQTILRIVSEVMDDSAVGAPPLASRVYRSGPMTSAECDALPTPLFEPLDDYLAPRTVPVLVTKGCYWGQCTFCDYPRLSDLGGRRFVQRSPARVLSEIKYIQATRAPAKINLISDAIPPSWYRALARAAIEGDVNLKTWSYMMHQDNLDQPFFELLAKAGVRQINFGTESTIDRVLGLMKKQASFEVVRRNIRDAHAAGLTVVANAIVDYPTTTREEAFENLRRFEELLPYIGSLNPQMFDLTAGTPMAATPEAFGLAVPKSAYLKTNHGFHALEYSRTHDLSRTDRAALREAFFRLALKVKQRRRSGNAAHTEVGAPNDLIFDGSAVVLVEGGKYKVWLASLGAEWPVQAWEARLLEQAFDTAGAPMALEELRAIFSVANPPATVTFESWLSAQIESGVVLRDADVYVH